jgi:hypothetical protein
MKRRAASQLQQLGSRLVAGDGGAMFGTGRGVPLTQLPSAVSQQMRAAAMPAQAVATKLQPDVIPLTQVDSVGAISIVEPHEKDFVPKVFENVDGRRIEDGRYAAFQQEISGEKLADHQCLLSGSPLSQSHGCTSSSLHTVNVMHTQHQVF